MKKRLIFEVEEGETKSCSNCQMYYKDEDVAGCLDADYWCRFCNKYNMTTLKFIGEESSTINKQDNDND